MRRHRRDPSRTRVDRPASAVLVTLCIGEEDGVLAAVACARHGCQGDGLVTVVGRGPDRQRVWVSNPDRGALERWFAEPDSVLLSWAEGARLR